MIMLSVTSRTVYLAHLMMADYTKKEPFSQYCGQSPDWAAPYVLPFHSAHPLPINCCSFLVWHSPFPPLSPASLSFVPSSYKLMVSSARCCQACRTAA